MKPSAACDVVQPGFSLGATHHLKSYILADTGWEHNHCSIVDDFLFRFGNPPIGIRPTTLVKSLAMRRCSLGACWITFRQMMGSQLAREPGKSYRKSILSQSK
jgi:hypothetical protein